jgi:DNA polymerase-3 subunit beta
MKFTVETSALARELFKLQGIASSKSTMPILQNALIEARADGALLLHATDLDLSVSTELQCSVESAGRVTVRARDLYDTVKNLKTDSVTLERDDNQYLMLRAGTVRARFIGMDPQEYPAVPVAGDGPFFPVRTAALLRMIDRTFFSISTDDGRPSLTGALVQRLSGTRLVMVSTDGHRLSKVEIGTEDEKGPKALEQGLIVPKKGLSELRRTVDVTAESLTIGVTPQGSVVFRHGNTSLYVRPIDQAFPNFQQVVPEEREERRATINRAEFAERLRLVSLFANAKTHNVRLQLEDDTCTILAQDPDKGECEERLQVGYGGPAVRAGYNFKYLQDIIGTLDCQQISIEVIDTLSPTVLHEVDGEDGEKSLFIVMPMRL